jgi:hypothetical protein
MLFFHRVGKMSSVPPPAGRMSAAIVVVAWRWKEYHVVAAVEGHELKTPETEHRPGPERLLETAHLELDGKLCACSRGVTSVHAGEGSERPQESACPVLGPARPTFSKKALVLPLIGVRRGSRCTMGA